MSLGFYRATLYGRSNKVRIVFKFSNFVHISNFVHFINFENYNGTDMPVHCRLMLTKYIIENKKPF